MENYTCGVSSKWKAHWWCHFKTCWRVSRLVKKIDFSGVPENYRCWWNEASIGHQSKAYKGWYRSLLVSDFEKLQKYELVVAHGISKIIVYLLSEYRFSAFWHD